MNRLLTALCISCALLLASCEERPSSRFALEDTRDRDIEILKAGDYDGAIKADREGNYELAFEKLLPMAEAGYSAAQAAVGHYYEKGKGVEQDYSKARTWYRKAADQGLSLPQTYLGALYLKGLGGPQDIDEAVKWFTRAAVKGWPQALLMLALMHDFGAGIPQDDIEAYRFYRVGWDYVGWDGKSKSELAQKIQKRLRIVEERMSMDEIEEGDRRVQEWEEQHPKPRYVY